MSALSQISQMYQIMEQKITAPWQNCFRTLYVNKHSKVWGWAKKMPPFSIARMEMASVKFGCYFDSELAALFRNTVQELDGIVDKIEKAMLAYKDPMMWETSMRNQIRRLESLNATSTPEEYEEIDYYLLIVCNQLFRMRAISLYEFRGRVDLDGTKRYEKYTPTELCEAAIYYGNISAFKSYFPQVEVGDRVGLLKQAEERVLTFKPATVGPDSGPWPSEHIENYGAIYDFAAAHI